VEGLWQHGYEALRFIKGEELFDQLNDCWLLNVFKRNVRTYNCALNNPNSLALKVMLHLQIKITFIYIKVLCNKSLVQVTLKVLVV
jgi:hypothetical protein